MAVSPAPRVHKALPLSACHLHPWQSFFVHRIGATFLGTAGLLPLTCKWDQNYWKRPNLQFHGAVLWPLRPPRDVAVKMLASDEG